MDLMKNTFKRIGLIAKLNNPRVAETLTTLTTDLEQRGVSVVLDESAASYFPTPQLTVYTRHELSQNCDLAIAVGGDGTMLNAARSLAEADVPMLGINLGRLGFLADVSPDEINERLTEIFNGQYEEEQRSLLNAKVMRNEKLVSESDALNDVVIHKDDIARMIDLDTTINDRFIYSLRADGLIISTPTGSTAYALSGGGPILQPNLPAFVLVPICPHTLSNRPVVVDENSTIEVTIKGSETDKAQITCDGQVNFSLLPGDRIQVKRKTHQLRLIHPADHDHFNTMRKKLHWAEQP
jgi:NAD+ kinase